MTDNCGTVAGYSAHRRRGEATCQPCRDARARYSRRRDALAGTCKEDGCDRAVRARDWCGTHLSRVDRHGSPVLVVPLTAAQKFWPLTIDGPVPAYAPHLGACLLWTGPIGSKGYGKFSHGRGNLWLAHRWSYTEVVGPIPDDLPELDHLCRVQTCVRPHHLEPVTRAENLRRQHEARKAAA